MNLVDSEPIDLFPPSCRNRHALQRLRAGELDETASRALVQHLTGCPQCTQLQLELEADEAAVRAAVPLARLQARLQAGPPLAEVVPRRRFARAAPWAALALAAGIAGLVLLPRRATAPVVQQSRTKGGLGLDVFVGRAGESRRVDDREFALGPGENLRLKVHGNGHRFVAVVSIDEGGKVSPVYFAGGESLPLVGPEELLPQSIAFDGHGRERLVVLLSDGPLERDAVERATREAFEKAGGILNMGKLGLQGVDELDRTVLKPEAR